MRTRGGDDLRRGIAFVIDARRVPSARACGRAVVCEIVEKENVATRDADGAFERAVNLAPRLFEPEEMRRVSMFDGRERRESHECIPVPIVGIRKTRRHCAGRANRAKRVRNTGVLVCEDRIVRGKQRFARNAATKDGMRAIDEGIAILFAALMRRRVCVNIASFLVGDRFKDVSGDACRVQSLFERTANANDNAAEVDTHKTDGMTCNHEMLDVRRMQPIAAATSARVVHALRRVVLVELSVGNDERVSRAASAARAASFARFCSARRSRKNARNNSTHWFDNTPPCISQR